MASWHDYNKTSEKRFGELQEKTKYDRYSNEYDMAERLAEDNKRLMREKEELESAIKRCKLKEKYSSSTPVPLRVRYSQCQLYSDQECVDDYQCEKCDMFKTEEILTNVRHYKLEYDDYYGYSLETVTVNYKENSYTDLQHVADAKTGRVIYTPEMSYPTENAKANEGDEAK